MYIKQIYTNCLAEASYYIESRGEAAVIDPIREPEPYLELARSRGAQIKYVFETHFHADFVSGHIDLARASGAAIVYGPTAQTDYETYIGKDNELFSLGEVNIRLLHTPGHTPESSCYLLVDEQGKDHAVFTGDTLFIGDVGRPDLAIRSSLTQDDLAGMLYDSLQNRLMPLADEVILYPGHGAGSSCGKNLSSETVSTIGEQKATNYALQDMPKEAFIKEVTEGLLAPPPYFFKDAMINKKGYESVEVVMKQNLNALSPEDVEKEIEAGALVLDVRSADHFEKGHIKGAINIGLDGKYAIWVGTLLDIDRPLLIVAEPGTEEEAIARLTRVGYEKVKGYLKGGLEAWKAIGKPLDTIASIDSPEAAKWIHSGTYELLDVRKPGETEAGYVQGAVNIRLQELAGRIEELDREKDYLVYCAGGYRSMVAASIMKIQGFNKVTNIKGGFGKLKQEDIPIAQNKPEGVS